MAFVPQDYVAWQRFIAFSRDEQIAYFDSFQNNSIKISIDQNSFIGRYDVPQDTLGLPPVSVDRITDFTLAAYVQFPDSPNAPAFVPPTGTTFTAKPSPTASLTILANYESIDDAENLRLRLFSEGNFTGTARSLVWVIRE